MKLDNKIMLITYADSLGQNLKELLKTLETHYLGAVGGVHILPFFPSSGDRGFAPMRYDQVEAQFGDFSDVRAIGDKHPLMFDFMVNHISRSSPYFQDYLQKKEESAWKDLFLRYDSIWKNGTPTQEQVDRIYKRKPRAPYMEETFGDGSVEKLWCTFSEEQMDLDVRTETTRTFFRQTLANLCQQGAAIIRLDAFAYAVKKEDTSCFFVEPDIWELLHDIEDMVSPYGAEILPEIHEHYSLQMKIAEQGFWVYDFALPMLTLHALYTGKGDKLKAWLDMCPKKQFTTLDTHDGLGVVDVADLLSPEEIEVTRDILFSRGANVKRKYNTADYNNLDIYQINTTYYSALGEDDQAYLLSRAIQFFAPGIPQVYYVGMLAGCNDVDLVEKTRNGRDINRHGYTLAEIAHEIETRPVVSRLRDLMHMRNTHPAFAVEGDCITRLAGGENEMEIVRTFEGHTAKLTANLKTHAFQIQLSDN